MVRLRLALCLLAPAYSLAGGCYSDRLPPPNFRHSCSSDADCNSVEDCISGLCQRPCTQATSSEDCPQDDGFVACFNGACVTTCALLPKECTGEGEDEECTRPETRSTCTSPLTCIDLGVALSGGSSFISSGEASEDVGICGQACSATSCPEGEICIADFCVAMCDPSGPDTCNSAFGLACDPNQGLCLPMIEGTSGTATDATATDATMSMTMSTSMTTEPPTTEGGDSTTMASGGSG